MELESFWRAHLEGWRRSDLNQRQYCEAHGLPPKRFGNWLAKLRHEEPAGAGKLLYRRGGELKHMSKEPVPYIPSPRSTPPGGRRRFSKSDKKRIVAGPAPPRGIGLGRGPLVWDNCAATVPLEAGSGAGGADRDDLSTRDAHGYTGSIGGGFPSVLGPVPVIVERAAPGIEVELIGGRRVRF